MYCCVCRSVNSSVKLLDITGGETHIIKSVIVKYFWFIGLSDGDNDEKICQNCWDHLRDFHEFFIKIEITHKNTPALLFNEDQENPIKPEFRLEDIKIEPLDFVHVQELDVLEQTDNTENDLETKKKRKKKKDTLKLKSKVKSVKQSPESKNEPEYVSDDPFEIENNDEDYTDFSDSDDSILDDVKNEKLIVDSKQADVLIQEFFGAIKCQICAKVFDSFNEMIDHCKTEHGEKGFLECCGFKLKRRTDAHTHVLEHKDPETHLVCEVCNKKFKRRKHMLSHKRNIHTPEDEKPFACGKCPRRFLLQSELNYHKTYHNDKNICCPEPNCKKMYANKSLLHEHLKSHEKGGSHKSEEQDKLIKEFFTLLCHVCEQHFEKFTDLADHCKAAHNEKAYVECCGFKLKRKTDVHTHALEHKDPHTNLVCDICNKQFKRRKHMMFHKKHMHTPDEEKPYACDKCPKRFMTKCEIKFHLTFHEEKMFICSEATCRKKFANQSRLNGHMKMHDTSNDIICDVCSKAFKSKEHFRYHMRQHNNEKQQCPMCGIWVFHVKKHMRSHVDGQEWKCEECGKIHHTEASLRSHIQYTHRMGRNHKCPYCEKTFKITLNLKEHIATHTGEALYMCPTCPRTFISSSNMYKHRKICAQSQSMNK